MFRILITGSRSWTDKAEIEEAIINVVSEKFVCTRDEIYLIAHQVWVIHGGALGADTLADEVAKDFGFGREKHLPDYENYPKRIAPLRRNDLMVKLGADVLLAFRLDMSRGTTYTINKATNAGIPIRIIDYATAADGTQIKTGEFAFGQETLYEQD